MQEEDPISDFEQIVARQTLHEFLLENLYARMALDSPNPRENARQFTNELVEACGRSYTLRIVLDADQQDVLKRIRRCLLDTARNFGEKVQVRVEEEGAKDTQ